MDFQPRPRPVPGRRQTCRAANGSTTVIDPDHWVALANGDDEPTTDDPPPARPDAERVERLTERLLEVMSDDRATMVPPTAGGMSRREWDALPRRRRLGFTLRQLRGMDPRLFTRAVLRSPGRRSRHFNA